MKTLFPLQRPFLTFSTKLGLFCQLANAFYIWTKNHITLEQFCSDSTKAIRWNSVDAQN